MGLWRQMLWVWQGYGQWCGEGYETLPWVADEAQLFPKATWGIKDMEHWGRSASYSCGVDYCRPHSGHKVLTFVDTSYLDTLRYQAFQIPDAYGWCVWIVNFFFFFGGVWQESWGCHWILGEMEGSWIWWSYMGSRRWCGSVSDWNHKIQIYHGSYQEAKRFDTWQQGAETTAEGFQTIWGHTQVLSGR